MPSGKNFKRLEYDADQKNTLCTFYYHAHANESKILVSHERQATVMDMLRSVCVCARHIYSGAQRQKPTKEEAEAKDSATDLEYSCVEGEEAMDLPGNRTDAQADSKVLLAPPAFRCRSSDASGQSRLFSSANPAGSSTPQSVDTEKPRCHYEHQRVPPAAQSHLVSFTVHSLSSPHSLHIDQRQRKPRLGPKQMLLLQRLNPLNLPLGGFVSVFSSHAEYTSLTRCHRTSLVASADVLDCWVVLLRCVCSCILTAQDAQRRQLQPYQKVEEGNGSVAHLASQARHGASDSVHDGDALSLQGYRFPSLDESTCTTSRRPSFAKANLSGVYVHRQSRGDFEFGVVTCGGRPHYEIVGLLSFFMEQLSLPFPHMYGLLPIGGGLRAVSLKVWWTPQERRVTPHTPLAPIQLTLEETCGTFSDARRTGNGRSGEAPRCFSAYGCVMWYLSRPIASQLQGTCQVQLPHVSAACAPCPVKAEAGERRLDTRRSGSKVGHVCHTSTTLTATAAAAVRHVGSCESFLCSDGSAAPLPSGLVKITCLPTGVCRASISFTDFSVSQTGEHMLAVEVRPEPEYAPFVPTLCDFVTPFLVVAAEEAQRCE